MPASRWADLGNIDLARLREARLQAHFAAQWLARAARAYAKPEPDDSHSNLGWNENLDGFLTRPLGTFRVALRLAPLALALADTDTSDWAFLSLASRADADLGRWLGDQIGARGLDPRRLALPSPYAMPEHPIGQGARYGADLDDAFGELARWFRLGQQAIAATRADLNARGLRAPEPRCWPHHFDLATQTSFPVAVGATAYVGAGLSPGDHYYEEPYFYVSLYPRPEVASLPILPPVGRWHDHEFTAAIAPASNILAAQDRGDAVDFFLAVAVDATIERLAEGKGGT
jgi:hypothetical protein